MARGPRYSVAFRRRREGKTNFHLRRQLVASRMNRFVARTSNSHTLAQIMQAKIFGDATLAAAHSKELEERGWKGGSGNVCAAYLVGLLAGKKAMNKGITKAILDIGLAVPIYGSRVFSVLKGAVDSGMEISHSDTVFPDESRIRGEHIASYATLLAEEDEDMYSKRFSKYIERGLKPEDLPGHFDEIKAKIEAE